jgi:phospholipid N-methyltransferase
MEAQSTTPLIRHFKWLDSLRRYVVAFLRWPSCVASIVPSSRAVQKRFSTLACVRTADFVIELGAGTGVTTKALLDQMKPTAKLLAFEVVSDFIDPLRGIDDRRLEVAQVDAAELSNLLQTNYDQSPEVIVSGLPFSTLGETKARQIMAQIFDAMPPGGSFVAYQVRDVITRFAEPLFGAPEVSIIWINLPPLRLYRWTKPKPS